MMKKHILKIRGTDKFVFDSIKKGEKTIETRAATPRYRKIETGDVLVFSCAGEKLEREVKKVSLFKNVDDMAGKIDYKKVQPFSGSLDEVKKVYYSFPGYREKIKGFGLIAFDLE